ncbi:sulfite exporter TauE/SafE family protein [Bacillus timonensis]|nr:sulfite exporter TauE/SafE family protein [Bacillus timonensis]
MNELSLFIIGFFATFIGTLAGGGGLISLPAMLLIGVPIHSAIAANKFSNTFSSFSSFFVLLKQKKIKLKAALIIAPFSIVGGITGGYVASSLSDRIMMVIAILLLCIALLLSFLKKTEPTSEAETTVKKQMFPYLYGIGVYDGMFGPGQGTLLMYTFLHHGFSYLAAVAFTRFQTFLSCLGAFTMFYVSGHFNWQIAIFLALGSLVGAQASLVVANKISTAHLKLLLRVVTLLLIVELTFKLFN